MSNTLRTVSVIIPVYNGERYLAEAIDSALAQTYPVLEVTVIDDGSTDGSRAVAARFDAPVRCVAQEHGGIAAARNHGVEEARGDFLAFLDADDLWLADKLQAQMGALNADRELEAVFGLVEQFYSPETDEAFRKRIRCPEEPIAGRMPTAMVIRREALARVGAFDTRWLAGEWTSWYTRAVEAELRTLVLPQVVARRRLHENNNGLRYQDNLSSRMQILKQSLDRRRASGPPKSDS